MDPHTVSKGEFNGECIEQFKSIRRFKIAFVGKESKAINSSTNSFFSDPELLM